MRSGGPPVTRVTPPRDAPDRASHSTSGPPWGEAGPRRSPYGARTAGGTQTLHVCHICFLVVWGVYVGIYGKHGVSGV